MKCNDEHQHIYYLPKHIQVNFYCNHFHYNWICINHIYRVFFDIALFFYSIHIGFLIFHFQVYFHKLLKIINCIDEHLHIHYLPKHIQVNFYYNHFHYNWICINHIYRVFFDIFLEFHSIHMCFLIYHFQVYFRKLIKVINYIDEHKHIYY